MYLLDTNVVSETRRPRPHGGVLAWLGAVDPRHLHVSVVTIGEVALGIEALRARDPAKADGLEAWLEHLPDRFSVLTMDTRTYRAWARLFHGKPAHLYEDAMIAASAVVHDLTVVTRNVRDFTLLGVRTINPFART